jgi:pyruvate dehydrogenase E2 component (dihydrolipoamide acetyltransferase)
MSREKIILLEAEGAGEVTEYCVAIGDQVSEGDSLLIVESDKASMEIPATSSGIVTKWLVEIGDDVSQHTQLAKLEELVNNCEAPQTEIADQPAISKTINAQHNINAHNLDKPEIDKNTTELIITLNTQGEGEVVGEIVEFSVAIGDEIQEGDSIMVVESDKAAMDIPAQASGVLKSWLVELGNNVSQGQQLAVLSISSQSAEHSEVQEPATLIADITTDSTLDSTATLLQMAASQPTSVKKIPNSSEAELINKQKATSSAIKTSTNKNQSVGPAARKLAREMAVDLSQIVGSAYRGRILKEDIKAFVKQQMLNPKLSDKGQAHEHTNVIASMPRIDFSQFGEIDRQEMSAIAKATAAHMTRCWLNIPHVTLADEADITDLEVFRANIDPKEISLERKPTILPFIVMIIAKALRKYPIFNSSLDPDTQQIIIKKYINIGIAVDTPAGLLVPVIRNADKLSISELTLQINDLAHKAKNRKLSIEEMTGGCFTVSSLGPIGGTGFTPIVNGPEVAILGVASAQTKPVWDGDKFEPRKKLPLCLSFDHRVINGADAGKFMAMINSYIAQVAKVIL